MESPRFMVAAPSSGCGKTTLAAGLMAALSETHTVQGFKTGPDYIDPGYHTAATGRISRNLDTWMVPPEEVKATFARGQEGADLSIIEGGMGFYDGYDGRSDRGSSAEVAKLLSAPVVLVIDVAKMARSAGAIALGFQQFDPAVRIAGVIANRVGSEKHARWVTEAIESAGIAVLGCIPRSKTLHVPERHLGLHTAHERDNRTAVFLEQAKTTIKNHIDLDRVRAIAQSAPVLDLAAPPLPLAARGGVRIAVARDDAFCFYYEDNFDLLRAAGAEIVFFSPLQDEALPAGCAGLYLGGGYPELYADQLAANTRLLKSVRAAVQGGMPTFAECGGLMVLSESLVDAEGATHTMIGALPGQVRMSGKMVLGYREIKASRDTVLMPVGGVMRGHEFHYSEWIKPEMTADYPFIVRQRSGERLPQEGFAEGNLLASYVHLHFASNPEIAPNFVTACKNYLTP
jgi:cobyrinic acid a,c-diamide synthase